MSVTFFVTPDGDEMAVLPRADYEAMRGAIEHERAIADYRAGRLPGLSSDEVREMLAAATPLAFWRRRAGLTQSALAATVGVSQNYLSELETGKRAGPVELWLKLSHSLSIPLEALVEDDAG